MPPVNPPVVPVPGGGGVPPPGGGVVPPAGPAPGGVVPPVGPPAPGVAVLLALAPAAAVLIKSFIVFLL